MTRRKVKLCLLIAFVLGGSALVFLTPVRSLLTEVQTLSVRLREIGWLAPAIFVPAVAALTALGCPRLLLCPVAGMAFGLWPGLAWSQAGTLVGYYVQFMFVRWAGREYVMRRWPGMKRVARIRGIKGAIAVAFIRQLPVGGFYLNILLGLTQTSHRSFIFGSAIGLLPEAIPATMIGVGAGAAVHISWQAAALSVLAAVIALLVVAWLARYYVAHSRLPGAATVRELMKMNLENLENENGEEARDR